MNALILLEQPTYQHCSLTVDHLPTEDAGRKYNTTVLSSSFLASEFITLCVKMSGLIHIHLPFTM